ncbi:hypothetical protein DFH08DRAFT_1073922 [Mycena albidolilacea]|uniref:Uncharacterized protein n=1 Tax=Mycena albidolilacea TaxID=1033008 RepID=A0AAD7F0S1_9AGAR|nr:hypothetical protein DFH08DRAFT_1073922 [Mycena albidolilacea]
MFDTSESGAKYASSMQINQRAVRPLFIITSTFTTKAAQFARYVLSVLLSISAAAAYLLTAGESSTETAVEHPGVHTARPGARGACPRDYGSVGHRSRLGLEAAGLTDRTVVTLEGFLNAIDEFIKEAMARERAGGNVHVRVGAGKGTGQTEKRARTSSPPVP